MHGCFALAPNDGWKMMQKRLNAKSVHFFNSEFQSGLIVQVRQCRITLCSSARNLTWSTILSPNRFEQAENLHNSREKIFSLPINESFVVYFLTDSSFSFVYEICQMEDLVRKIFF